MNKLLVLMAAAMISSTSFAAMNGDVIENGADTSKFDTIAKSLTEAKDLIVSNDLVKGFENVTSAIVELEKIVKPDSDEAKKLSDLKAAIEDKKIENTEDSAKIEETKLFFDETEKSLIEMFDAIKKESTEEVKAEVTPATEDIKAEESTPAEVTPATEDIKAEDPTPAEVTPATEEKIDLNVSEEPTPADVTPATEDIKAEESTPADVTPATEEVKAEETKAEETKAEEKIDLNVSEEKPTEEEAPKKLFGIF